MFFLEKTKSNLFALIFAILFGLFIGLALVTENKLLWAPLLIILTWAWVRFATKFPAESLILIIFLVEDCFDIVSFGLRQRFLSDIGIALMLPLIALNMSRVLKHIFKVRSAYAKAILLFFAAICISLYFGSTMKFGQPFDVGLVVARKFLLVLSYFFLVAVSASQENCYRFLKYLAWLGALLAILTVAEAALGGGVIFSHYYAIGQERAGFLRIHVGTFLIVFSVIYSFLKALYLERTDIVRIIYLLIALLGLATLVFITMTRAVLLGILITFLFWISYKVNSRKIMLLCFTASLLAFFVLSGLFDEILSKSFVGKIMEMTKSEVFSYTGNISVRINGAKYYLELMLKNVPFTGIGIFSSTNYPNNPVTIAAERYHYFPIDINALTTLIYFGLQGLILLLYFTTKSIRDSYITMKRYAYPDKFNFEILLLIFVYTLATPTLNNIIVEKMLIYSGSFFYLLWLAATRLPTYKAYKS